VTTDPIVALTIHIGAITYTKSIVVPQSRLASNEPFLQMLDLIRQEMSDREIGDESEASIIQRLTLET
jgi:hypothetical protein